MDRIKQLNTSQIAGIDSEADRFLSTAADIREAKAQGGNPVVRDGGFVSLLTMFGLMYAQLGSIAGLHPDDQAIVAKVNLAQQKLSICIQEWQAILNDPSLTPGGPTKC